MIRMASEQDKQQRNKNAIKSIEYDYDDDDDDDDTFLMLVQGHLYPAFSTCFHQ